MAKTVDNLGVDVSTQWAQARVLYEDTSFKISEQVSSQSKVSITSPIYYGEFESLFGVKENKTQWALFSVPQNYASSRRRLFAERMVPSCGPVELQEAAKLRVQAVADEQPGAQEPSSPVKNEETTLCNLLDLIHRYDELLIDFNAKRTQYQKG